MKKRIFAIFTVLVLMVTSIGAGAAEKLTDISGLENKNEIELLYNLGIVEGNDEGEFMPEASVKRIEFAVMILRMLDMDEFSMSGEFDDIPVGHWAYRYAGTLKSMGIVEGIGENLFGIDMDVTYDQAQKMLVSALGYANVAEQQGGYPTGYNAMAGTLGITKDVPMTGAAVNRLSAALMIENCLEADMLRAGNEDTSDPDNILEDVLGFRKLRGTVDASFDAQGSKNLKYNQIVINGVTYEIDTENCIIDTTGLLGREVEFYVTERNYTDTICHIRPLRANDSLTVDAEDIAPATTTTELCYYKNGKIVSESIASPASVYYNGKIVPTANVTNALMKPADGSVAVTDTDNDGVYETVQIKAYTTKLVTRATDDTIYDAYGSNLKLEDCDYVEVYYNGKSVDVSEIQSGDILSVSMDMSGKNAYVLISRAYIDGKLTTTRTTARGGTEYTVVKDGTAAKHAVDSVYRKAADSNTYGVKKISIGTEGRFYLSALGKIAGYDKISVSDDGEEVTGEVHTRKNGMLYGYVWSSNYETGAENYVIMNTLTEANKYENIVVKNEAKFGRRSGGKYVYGKTKAADIYSALDGKKQMIAYKLDEDGFVEAMCLADTASNDDYFCLSVPENESFGFRNKMFGQKYYVDQDTVVFSTPEASAYYSYSMVGKYNDVFSDGGYYALAMYDVEEDGRIGAIHYDDGTFVKYTSSTGGNEIYIDPTNSPIMYVTDIVTEIDDGDEVTVIYGIENGEEVKRVLSESLLAKSDDPSLIETGTVIQYETNEIKIQRAENSEKREEIVLFKHVLNLNENNAYKTTFGYENSIISRISEATNLDDTGLTVSYANIKGVTPFAINIKSNREITLMKNMNINVMHYDRNSQVFEKRALDDLQTGMDVFVRQRKNNVLEIVYFD